MNLAGKEILIIRLGKIGDIIIASVVFDILKKRFPDLKISLLTLKRNKEVLKHNPNINKKYFSYKNISLYITLLRLGIYHYDFLLDLNDDPSRTSKFIRKLIRTNTTIGFDFGESKKPDISVVHPSKDKTHIIERIERLLNALNISPLKEEMHPVLYLGKSEEAEVFNQIEEIKKVYKIIALNISAGASIRDWAIEKYCELIKRLEQYDYLRFLILYAKDDVFKAERIMEVVTADKLIPMNYYSFQHFASYIRYSDLIITPDTSAVHIASAFNVPVIALYPFVEWNFVSWQPLSSVKRSLRSKTENINGITVDEVFTAFSDIQSQISVSTL